MQMQILKPQFELHLGQNIARSVKSLKHWRIVKSEHLSIFKQMKPSSNRVPHKRMQTSSLKHMHGIPKIAAKLPH
jgi:hypothetical protein